MTGPQTAREAMSKIVLGEIDQITVRLESIVTRLDALEGSRAGQSADTGSDLTLAKEKWNVVGAIASRAACEAAVAALRLERQREASPAAPARPTRLVIVLLVLNMLLTISGSVYLATLG